jgi:hypothetical protein
LRSRGEPRIGGFQRLDEADIKISPESLWPMTSVMPENSQDASKLYGGFNQFFAMFFGFGLGQIEPLRIE